MAKIIKFGAIWCNPCKAYEPILDRFKQLHPEVEFQYIDTEEGSEEVDELIKLYNVRSLPTLIIIRDDGTSERLAGLQTVEVIESTLYNN